MSLDTPRLPPPSAPVCFVDAHSGRGVRFDSVDEVRRLVACVARRVEGELAGRRFPLLHVLENGRPLTGTECEALVWELARLRTILSTLPAVSTPAEGAALPDGPHSRTLADVHLPTIVGLDHAARLGAASRRGARFEAAEGASSDGAVAARRYVEGR